MSTFRLPDLGEGLEEAEIVAWHVADGEHVVADQPLISVETDKAVVEIPSPRAGRIARLHGAPGDIVKVGAPLVDYADVEPPDTGTVVGDVETAAPPASRQVAAGPADRAGRVVPAARALAKSLGVDLGQIVGTGPGGIVTRADVEKAASTRVEGGEALRGARRSMARAMADAHARVALATVHDEADVERWITPTADVTVRLIRAVVAGCRAEPALNAWFDALSGTRRLLDRIDLGIAIDTPDGLYAPVLRDVAGRDASALRQDIDRLRALAAERRLSPETLKGPTITLSNFGTVAGRHATMLVVPPQVAILGAGRIRAEARVQEGVLAARRMVPLSLSFDHRVVTGGEAARFLAAVMRDLEQAA